MKSKKKLAAILAAVLILCAQCIFMLSAGAEEESSLTGTAIKTLEIRKGSATGEVVRDLLDSSDKTPIDPATDYYLYVEFLNPANTGETAYVELDFGTTDGEANGLKFFNPPGGSDMKVGEISHDYLAALYSYTDNPNPTYGSSTGKLALTDGKLVYTVKSDVAKNAVVSFATGLIVAQEYCESEIEDALRVECGLITDGTLVYASGVEEDLYVNYSPEFVTQIISNPVSATIDGTGLLCTRVWSGSSASIPIIFDEVQYTVTVPKDAVLEDYGWGYNTVGSKTDSTKGTIYIDPTPVVDGDYATYTVTISNGYKTATATLDVTTKFSFPRESFPEQSSDYKVYMNAGYIKPAAGGENLTLATKETYIKLLDPAVDNTTVTSCSHTVYNNTIQTGEAGGYLTMMGKIRILNSSELSTPYDKCFEAEYNTTNTAAAITAVTVPKGTNTSPVITYVGYDADGNEVSGTIDTALSRISASQNYYLFFAEDLGIQSFKSIKAEIGQLTGKYDSNSWTANYAYGDSKSAAFGYFTTDEAGIQVINTYHIYNSDPLVRDQKNGDLQATSTVTSTDVAGSCFSVSMSANYIRNAAGTVKESFVAGSEVWIKNAYVYPYCVPTAGYGYADGSRTSGTTAVLNDPVIYLTLPKGISYTDFVFQDCVYNWNGSLTTTTDLTYNVENVSYLNKTDDGVSIYKITFDNLPLLGYYDEEGCQHRLKYSIGFSTAKTLSTQRYELNELVHVTSETTDYIGMRYTSPSSSICAYTEDTYGLNGGNTLAGIAPVSEPPVGFGIQGLSEIMVSTAITVSKINDEDVSDPQWYTYDESDPSSIALLGLKSEGTYSVTLKNPGSELEDVSLRMFIPIPKKNVDLGDTFMDEASSFDMNFSWDEEELSSLGLSAQYVSVSGTYDDEGVLSDNITYTASDAENANAILLTFTGNFEEAASKVVNFKFTTDGTTEDLEKINIWRDAYFYTSSLDVNGRSLYGDYVASETAGGTLTGVVFEDINRNGIRDAGEIAVSGITVTLKDSKKRVYSTTTDEDGIYEFQAVREDTVEITMTADSSMGQRFNIEAITPVEGYVCSAVTPAEDGLSASKTIDVEDGKNVVNAAMGQYYKLSYDGNGSTNGIVPKTQEYAKDATVTVSVKPDSLVKTGQKFVSWNTEADGSGTEYVPGASFTISADTILYAQWTPATYTITFNYNGATGGNDIVSKDVVYKTKIGSDGWPSSPTKTGYTFRYWAKNNPATATSAGSTYNANSTYNIAANTTLYAWWSEKTGYIVSYDTDGGSEISDKTVSWNGTVTAEETPVKAGYEFSGWVCGTTEITDTTAFSDLSESDETGASVTLKAVWKEKTGFTVHYDTNGGSDVEDKTVSWNQKELLPSVNPTRTDEGTKKYSLAGWKLTDADGDEVLDTDKYSELTGGDDSITEITLFAVWEERVNNTVHYDTNGGNAIVDKTNVAGDESGLLPANDPSKEGYTFEGWYYGNTKISDTTVYNTLTDSDELTLTANWTEKSYKVLYNPGNDTVISDKENVTWGEADLLPDSEPVRTGYDFSGWYLEGTTTKVTETTAYSELAEDDTVESITLEARWTLKSGYAVTYDTAGGSAVAVKSGLTWNSSNLTDAASTRTGYTLEGWYYNGTRVTAADTYGDLAADDTVTSLELTAKWTPKTGYTVKYDTAGGQDISELTDVAWDQSGLIPEEIPAKAGYVFDHWSCERVSNVTETTAFSGMSTSDAAGSSVTLVANYTENKTYTVIYDTNGGTPESYENKENVAWSGKNLLPLETPERTGYEFVGWYCGTVKATDDSAYQILANGVDTPSVTLVARWTANSYTIGFDKNADDAEGSMSDLDADYDETVTLTANSFTRTGYTFAGWNTEADGSGDAYTDGEEVTNLTDEEEGSVTLYAQWTANSYTIRFDKNADSAVGTMADQTAAYDENVTLTENAFTRTGYTFAGWSTEADGSGDDYTDGTTVTNLTDEEDGSVTLYAQWVANDYTISFDKNADDAEGSMSDLDADYDETVTLTANSFTRTGYTFAGWNTEADGSGDDYTDGTTVTNLTDEEEGSVTLYAQWTANTYTISFDPNAADAEGTMADLATAYNETVTLPENAFTRTGYTFAGWNTEPDGSGDAYADGASVKNLSTGKNSSRRRAISDGDVTLYAQWTANAYNISFAKNADDAEGSMSDLDAAYDETVTLTANSFTRIGYTFAGWNTKADGSGTAYDDEAEVKNLTTEADDSVLLYAQWSVVTYSITYDLDGGTVDTENRTEYTVETEDFTLTNPTREHYTFAGWTGTELTEETLKVTVPEGSVGDRSYTANWKLNTYDVTYDGNGADANVPEDPEKHGFGTEVTVAEQLPERTDYDFSGWELDEDTLLQAGDTFTMPDAAVVLTAKWELRPTISFDTDGGTEISSRIVDAEHKLSEPEAPEKTGYEFAGWYTDEELTEAFDFDEPVPEGLTKLYAAWKAVSYSIAFELEGGAAAEGNPTAYTIETPDFTLVNPVKEGYDFLGWILVSDETADGSAAPNPNFVVASGTTGNLVFKAVWQEQEKEEGEEEPDSTPTPTPTEIPAEDSDTDDSGNNETAADTDGGAPKTGNSMNLEITLLLLMVSFAALLFMTVSGKREKPEE